MRKELSRCALALALIESKTRGGFVYFDTKTTTLRDQTKPTLGTQRPGNGSTLKAI